ncbi:MAG TPA: peptidoglycan bridge formation glycyltransferase FemA/FemB family protein [Bryobacteraceae bacterium]|nr:peptidoglycan bridge formation glycyltransferase FemA/FemB family protein [Bryobacteraceae bacterium]
MSTTNGASTLAQGYTGEVDRIDEQAWYDALDLFDDANIYQTWAYGTVLAGKRNVSHVVVRKDGEIVGIAQARLARVPVLNFGIAYVLWGPLWRRSGRPANPEVFQQVIRALRNEYVRKRGLSLRVSLKIVRNAACPFAEILANEGFESSRTNGSRTILMDLRPSIEELRNGMKAHWKRELKVGENNQIEIVPGTGADLFDQFITIYREMVARKRFVEPNDINEFRTIQTLLPERFKMKLLLAKSAGNISSGVIASAIGDTALYLFGATSNAGMKSRGSYILQWKIVEQLKRDGISVYDLNGINPETNPGTYKFKNDMAADNGTHVYFPGTFDAHESFLSRLCVEGWNTMKAKRGVLRRMSVLSMPYTRKQRTQK